MSGLDFRVAFDLDSINDQLDQLQTDVEEETRPAAQAGADVYYKEAVRLAPISSEVRTRRGKTYRPGALKKAIYQAYSKDNSGNDRHTYHVSWNARKAPHGHLIEHGHWTRKYGKHGPLKPHWVPAKSFIRRAFDNKRAAAIEAVNRTLLERIRARRSKRP